MSDERKWLRALREQREAFLAIVEQTTALSTFAHLLRAAVDVRPLSERIEDAVRRVAPSFPAAQCKDPKAAQVVVAKIERRLPELALAEVPDVRTVAKVLRKLDSDNRSHFGGEMSPPSGMTVYASTEKST